MKNCNLLFLLLTVIYSFTIVNLQFAVAEDDIIEGDVEDGAVTADEADVEPDDDDISTTSPDADTYLLFTKPNYVYGQQLDLPGGKPVEFLVGFANNGNNEFRVETVEASFRYPMDFNYYIQNFSRVAYNRQVPSGQEATVSYSFLPSDQFAGRPFGLNIILNYRDANGVQYNEAIFNETVLISEVDEGLDVETFFLYVLLAGIVILLLVIGQQYFLGSSGKHTRITTKKVIETGTNDSNDVDYEWLPLETLRVLQNASPKSKTTKSSSKQNAKLNSAKSPKKAQSPKQKKTVKQN